MERGISLLGKLLRFSGGDVGPAAGLSVLKGERPTMTQGRGQVTRGYIKNIKGRGTLTDETSQGQGIERRGFKIESGRKCFKVV
jgi:hypothetical protein